MRLTRPLMLQLQSALFAKSIQVEKVITQDMVSSFAAITGDTNPIHYTNDANIGVVHGALLNGVVSGVIGTQLPGHGTLLIEEKLQFPNPCFVGDTVLITVAIAALRKVTNCSFKISRKQNNVVVLEGTARLLVPTTLSTVHTTTDTNKTVTT